MAISGTYTFNPDISELVEEAYERAGLELRSGYDLRTARRSLNFLMLEWQNRGLNLWTIEEKTLLGGGTDDTLVQGTDTYNIALGTIGLLDVILRTNAGNANTQSDYHLSRVSEPTYANIRQSSPRLALSSICSTGSRSCPGTVLGLTCLLLLRCGRFPISQTSTRFCIGA